MATLGESSEEEKFTLVAADTMRTAVLDGTQPFPSVWVLTLGWRCKAEGRLSYKYQHPGNNKLYLLGFIDEVAFDTHIEFDEQPFVRCVQLPKTKRFVSLSIGYDTWYCLSGKTRMNLALFAYTLCTSLCYIYDLFMGSCVLYPADGELFWTGPKEYSIVRSSLLFAPTPLPLIKVDARGKDVVFLTGKYTDIERVMRISLTDAYIKY